jgi:hypothetical protein
MTSLPPGWSFGSRTRIKAPPVPDRRLQDGPGGYRVVAVRAGDGWRFMAWGPDRSAGWSYRDWRDGKCPHWSGQDPKTHYPRGESIPQPSLLLGVFTSASEARAACGYPDVR